MDSASLGFRPGFQPICCLGRQPDVAVKRSILATPMVVIYRYGQDHILGVHFLLFLNVTFIELLFNVGGRLEAGIGDFCFTGSLLFFFLLFLLLKNPKLRLAGHMLPPFFVPFLGFTDLFGPFLVKPEKKKSFLKCFYMNLY